MLFYVTIEFESLSVMIFNLLIGMILFGHAKRVSATTPASSAIHATRIPTTKAMMSTFIIQIRPVAVTVGTSVRGVLPGSVRCTLPIIWLLSD
jgi:hypothetical protein